MDPDLRWFRAGAFNKAQLHNIQMSLGRRMAQHMSVGALLSAVTTGGYYAAGLLGAHPLVRAVVAPPSSHLTSTLAPADRLRVCVWAV
jgi:hypothetical protein